MEIFDYRTLINSLPVTRQSFIVKRKTWLKFEKDFIWLKKINDEIFNGQQNINISRQDIFNTSNEKELILKTIYWGYPNGMRGRHFINILTHINSIEHQLNILKKIKNPSENDFYGLASKFKNTPGLGISTYTKFLYFFKISFDKIPCLILDNNLIDVFKNEIFIDFSILNNIRYTNADKNYIIYLQQINNISKRLKIQGENIEQFLFLFGKNLKH